MTGHVMLTIRSAQWAAFEEEAAKNRRERQIFDLLREDHPRTVAGRSDAELLAFVRACVMRAARHRIVEPTDVVTFACVAQRLGLTFDEHPIVEELLASPGFQPAELERVLEENLHGIDVLQILAMRH